MAAGAEGGHGQVPGRGWVTDLQGRLVIELHHQMGPKSQRASIH